MLLNLYEPAGHAAPTPQHLAHIDAVVSARFSFPIKRGAVRTLRQLSGAHRLPWHAATRLPDAAEYAEFERKVLAFAPDAVWLDGPWFGELAKAVAAGHGLPLLYRSHNIEFKYLRGQARAAASWRNRLAWHMACIGLERYELDLMRRADRVFDISVDDLQYWRERGVQRNSWLPPLPELALSKPVGDRIGSELLFVGNLRTPNNIMGVSWLVREVLPLLRQHRPEIRLMVVGSMPEPALRDMLEAQPAVDARYDVADVTPYLFGARVLLNPVPVGSGVQVKMLDMLMTDAPIVSRPQGVKGLPAACAKLFDVADAAADYAAMVLRRLDEPGVDLAAREGARKQFSISAVGEALRQINPVKGGVVND
jgi:glycosyltransferase involved in cell wall biosynthesis